MFLVQMLNAGHDKNGNPKRVYVVYNAHGTALDAFDDGYLGEKAIPDKYRPYNSLPEVKVPHAEYKKWLRTAKEVHGR